MTHAPCRTALILAISLLGTAQDLVTAELKPRTLEAFDRYVRETEGTLERGLPQEPFLWADGAPGRRDQLRQGNVLTERLRVGREIPDAMLHDWTGAIFIPGTTLSKTIALVQDYDNHKNIYKPEVIDSRLISRKSDDFKIFLRLLKKKVLTVVLNTEHEVHYVPLGPTRYFSRSRTTKIAEVENPGKPDERELAPGQGHGFLWRLNSYWKFEEADGGVYMECRAISLTRDVPTGLGWVIGPIVRDLPRESLESTLRATQRALGN